MRVIVLALLVVSVGLASAHLFGSSSQEDHLQAFKAYVQNQRQILDGNQISSLQNLRQSLQNQGFNIKTPGADLTYKDVKKAVADFVGRNVGKLENSKDGKAKFDEFFGKAVLKPCNVLTQQIPRKAYKELLHATEIQNQIDMDTYEWLVTARICFAITEKDKKAALDGYETLLGHKYHSSSLGHLLHKAHVFRRR